MDASRAEARVAQTLVLAILDELRANPRARRELRTLLDERKSNDRLLSPYEAAEHLGVHPKTLTRAAAAGQSRAPGASAAIGALILPSWRWSRHAALRQHPDRSLGYVCGVAARPRTRFGLPVPRSECVARRVRNTSRGAPSSRNAKEDGC